MDSDRHIAVIGAGIVGLSCALWLQRKGFDVSLIDPADPGSGASSGNACTIADYACVPVNSPDIFKSLPKLLFSPDSPLSLRPGYALRHPLWMLDFLLNCRKKKVERSIRLLARLLAQTWDGLDPLLDQADARDLLEQRGCLYLYRTEAQFTAAQAGNARRRRHGVEYREVDGGEIRELEPNLKPEFARGLLFESASHVLNPLTLCQRYFDRFQRDGGTFVRARARAVWHGVDSVEVELDAGEPGDAPRVAARRVVVAAGAFSKRIEGVPMQLLPLDTERGYHVQYDGLQHLVSRPVSYNEAGFYATPMNEGLRFAGTVEFAGLDAPPNPRRLEFLARRAGELLDLPAKPDREWLGFRPTLPDALPVIGFSTVSEYILYAFGHQHVGLTLAGITGKLIAELANRETPSLDVKPFSPARFL